MGKPMIQKIGTFMRARSTNDSQTLETQLKVSNLLDDISSTTGIDDLGKERNLKNVLDAIAPELEINIIDNKAEKKPYH